MASGTGELNMEIVGVVQNAKYSEVKEVIPPLYYTPYRQEEFGFLSFYVRTASDPTSVMRAIPGVVARLDPDLPIEELKTLEDQARESVFLDRMISRMSAAFAVLATLLAAIGLYGVLAYTVAQRTREIGLRMALGAGAEQVRAMVLKQVSRMVAIGIGAGLIAAYGMGRLARSLLYELEAHDPVVILTVTALLAAIALGAAFVPALRASRVDPMRALRYE
jgi:ABC-type antimicrobial peptide transport system permease subunit